MRRTIEFGAAGLALGLLVPKIGALVGVILGACLGAAVTNRRRGMSWLSMAGWGGAGFGLAAGTQIVYSGYTGRALAALGAGVGLAVAIMAVWAWRLLTSPHRAQEGAPRPVPAIAAWAYWYLYLAAWWAWRGVTPLVDQVRMVFARPGEETQQEVNQ